MDSKLLLVVTLVSLASEAQIASSSDALLNHPHNIPTGQISSLHGGPTADLPMRRADVVVDHQHPPSSFSSTNIPIRGNSLSINQPMRGVSQSVYRPINSPEAAILRPINQPGALLAQPLDLLMGRPPPMPPPQQQMALTAALPMTSPLNALQSSLAHPQRYYFDNDIRRDSYGSYRYVRGRRVYLMCNDPRADPRIGDCRATGGFLGSRTGYLGDLYRRNSELLDGEGSFRTVGVRRRSPGLSSSVPTRFGFRGGTLMRDGSSCSYLSDESYGTAGMGGNRYLYRRGRAARSSSSYAIFNVGAEQKLADVDPSLNEVDVDVDDPWKRKNATKAPWRSSRQKRHYPYRYDSLHGDGSHPPHHIYGTDMPPHTSAMADMNAVMVEAAAASPPLTDCIEANRECEFEAELSCDIGASVSTGRVRWTKLDGRDSYYSMGVRSGYGDVISSFGGRARLADNGNTLLIRHVNSEDKGVYICEVDDLSSASRLRSMGRTARLRKRVNFFPRFPCD